jgi:integrase
MAWVVSRQGHDGGLRFQVRFRDATGTTRTVGTYASRREALKAGRRVDNRVEDGTWINPAAGRVTFRDYLEETWWPSRHLEVSTRASYRSYLDRHFIPFFGPRAMSSITPSLVQAWVTKASAEGLSPRSVTKYHVMLHGVFRRAVRDRVILHNPCADTELPKVIPRKVRILTPEEFDRLLAEIPERFTDLVLTDIETGLRWGELVALRPRHIDFLRRLVSVEETVVEVSKRNSPTGERMVFKPYPKDDESRTLRVSQGLLEGLARRIERMQLGRDDLLFPSTEERGDIPLSRNTFRTRYWLPPLSRAGIDFHVRVHDLRHAHASWLLAGGADLKAVMDRLGHSQIQTTQKYLHTLPDADDKALDAFTRIRSRTQLTQSAGPTWIP